MRLFQDRRSVIELPTGVDIFLQVASRMLLLAAVVYFAFEATQRHIPRDPEGGPFTDDVLVPLQLGLLALTAVGLVISFRWTAVAAAIVAVGGTGLGVLATLQYEPPFGFFVMLAFLVPAVMMWLDWQHQETWGKIGVLAVSTSVLLLMSWAGAAQLYDIYLGPSHPQSTIEALPDSPVEWLWSGAVDSGGFTVTARLRDEAREVVVIIRDDGGAEVARSAPAEVTDAREPVTLSVDGLEPSTEYEYVVMIDGEIDQVRVGRTQTFASGPSSFTVAVGACARTNSNGSVFETIRETDPDLYLIMGDLHYRNIMDNSRSEFSSAFAQVHDAPAQSALYRSVSIAYVWDDHDFGPNDADGDSPSRPAAWAAYRSHVPHYDLPSGDAGPIHQAFTMGRVRFLLIDTRSERDSDTAELLGEEQLEWLLAEILAARDSHGLTVLMSPTPWIGVDDPTSDNWGGFADERRRIAEFLAEHDITNLVMVSGDAHMVAIDDGTNSGYGGHAGFPLLHAAALDRPGSVKGGPYSNGTFPGAGQFGLIEVTDTGSDQIDVSLVGLTYEEKELVRLDLSFQVPASAQLE